MHKILSRIVHVVALTALAILIVSVEACDPVKPTAPPVDGPKPQFTIYDCQLANGGCDELRLLLIDLKDHFGDHHECSDIISKAQERFDSEAEGVGFRDGGTSTTIYGYILPSESGITRVTSMGYTDLGPTVIHEEAHHQGVESDTYAEAVGRGCGEYPR